MLDSIFTTYLNWMSGGVELDDLVENGARQIDSGSYSVSWDLVSDRTSLRITEITSDASNDILVVSGVLPESESEYEYDLYFVAKAINITDSTFNQIFSSVTEVSTDFGVEANALAIQVEVDEHDKSTEADLQKYIDSYNAATIGKVAKDYSVLVTVSADYDSILGGYGVYIESDDDYMISVPEWLTYQVNSVYDGVIEDFEGTAITSVTIKFNDSYNGTLNDGEKAVVCIPFIKDDENNTLGINLKWEVEYSSTKAEPFKLAEHSKTFAVKAGGDNSLQSVNYTGADPVGSAKFNPDISANVKIEYTHANGKLNFTVSAPSTTQAGQYKTTATFTDAAGNSDAIEITVNVSVDNGQQPNTPPTSQDLTIAGNFAVSVDVGSNASTTLTVNGNFTGALTWTVGEISVEGLSATATASGNNSAKITINVADNVASGTYDVPITVTDGANNSGKVTLRVTVMQKTTPTPTPTNPNRVYRSGGGGGNCNTGLFGLAFVLVPLILVKKIRN